MSTNRKYSNIWVHFKEYGQLRAKCNYRKMSLSIAGGSNGNLSRHMKSKHPLVTLVTEREPTSHDLPSSSSQNQIQRSIPSVPQRSHQPTMTHFIHRPPPIRKVEQIDNLVLEMVAKEHHALRIIDEPSFQKLITAASHCRGYNLPLRKTLTNTILPKEYNRIMNEINAAIRSAPAVCLTTDGWTSKTNTSYVAVTAHFIDGNSPLKTYLLACEEFGENHTAENLCNFLKKVMEEFDISNKVTAVVSDNAFNIIAAVRLGQWRSI
ncbi:E3 SUMO-protein ligase ZBED1-like [Haematobia irritans]|uniref:E3 SUMO-protein ligase ZBED1-like n=1 Tax=Haematobia irritans TaxID=7368 RepID=UPI003F502EBB